jgi:septum formation protein
MVPDVEELTQGDPEAVVVENARRKARAGLARAGGGRPVLGVDTEVVVEGRILGKAVDPASARERLEALSGRTHTVLSGVVVLVPSDDPAAEPRERAGCAHSEVTFHELDPAMLGAYVESGEWRDRAGAYAVQGLGSALVERVDGDLSNVIGLPVSLLFELVPDLLDPAGGSAARHASDA